MNMLLCFLPPVFFFSPVSLAAFYPPKPGQRMGSQLNLSRLKHLCLSNYLFLQWNLEEKAWDFSPFINYGGLYIPAGEMESSCLEASTLPFSICNLILETSGTGRGLRVGHLFFLLLQTPLHIMSFINKAFWVAPNVLVWWLIYKIGPVVKTLIWPP